MKTQTTVFAASATHESLPDGRAAGELALESEQLVFRYESGEIRLPLPGISIALGGANNKLIFFEHPAVPGWSIYTRDRAVLKTLRSPGSAVEEQLQGVHAGERRRTREWLLFAAVTVLIVVGLWQLKDPAIGLVAKFVPVSWEEKAGEVVYASVRAETKIIDDEELTKEFRTVLSPLLDSVKDTGYEFKIHIAQGDDLNAFALPGGHIVLNSAVILRADRLEEVLGVLAHEMSHVTKRHSVKQIFSVLGIYFVFDVFLGNFAGTFAALTQVAPYLLQQGFSRDHEREADNQGFEYLLRSEIDPSGMVEFFKRIQKQMEEDSLTSTVEKHLNFLSTHPGTEERILSLEAKVRENSSRRYRTLGAGFKEFKERLKSKLGQAEG